MYASLLPYNSTEGNVNYSRGCLLYSTRSEYPPYIHNSILYGGRIKWRHELHFEIVHIVQREYNEWTIVIGIVYYPVLFQSKVDSPKPTILFCPRNTHESSDIKCTITSRYTDLIERMLLRSMMHNSVQRITILFLNKMDSYWDENTRPINCNSDIRTLNNEK